MVFGACRNSSEHAEIILVKSQPKKSKIDFLNFFVPIFLSGQIGVPKKYRNREKTPEMNVSELDLICKKKRMKSIIF